MISMDRQYKTRDGRDVRLLCVDAVGELSVIGLIDNSLMRWKADGMVWGGGNQDRHDLIEVREKRRLSGFSNVFADGSVGPSFGNKPCHDSICSKGRIACIDLSRFEYEVGEGLE